MFGISDVQQAAEHAGHDDEPFGRQRFRRTRWSPDSWSFRFPRSGHDEHFLALWTADCERFDPYNQAGDQRAASSSNFFGAPAASTPLADGGETSTSAAASGFVFGGAAPTAPTAGLSSSVFGQPTAGSSKIFETAAPIPDPYAGLKVAPPPPSSYPFAGSFGGSSIPAVAPTPEMFLLPLSAATKTASSLFRQPIERAPSLFGKTGTTTSAPSAAPSTDSSTFGLPAASSATQAAVPAAGGLFGAKSVALPTYSAPASSAVGGLFGTPAVSSTFPSAPIASNSSAGGLFGGSAAPSVAVSQPPASSGQTSTAGIGITKPAASSSIANLPASAAAAPHPTPFRELDSSLNKMIASLEHQHLAYIQTVNRVNEYDQLLLQNQLGLEEFNRRLQQLEEEKDAFCMDVRMVSEMQAELEEELSRLEELIELPLAESVALNTAEQKRLAALNLLSDVTVQFDEMEAELEEAGELLHEVRNAEESVDNHETVENLEQIRRNFHSQWTSMTDVEKEANLLAERVQQDMGRATHLH
ncbi:hypothetical protein M3Y99_00711600 [Aphelenchoides fujianensis]|nr:hypothetical protein M3Y99_00711600 [Aphelenchoides fujianensis]